MKIGISNFIYKYFVKYDVLTSLVREAFANIEKDYLDIYIDGASIIRTIVNNAHNVIINNPNDIASSIVNLCIHYKYYFKSRFGMIPNIYLVMSYTGIYNTPKETCPEYNSKYVKRIVYAESLKENIEYNIGLLSSIIPYLPNIYLIQCEGVESNAMILANIYKNKESARDSANLIVSRDILNILAFSHPSLKKDIVFLYPCKNPVDGMDISKITDCNPNNVFRLFMSVYKPTIDISKYNNIPTELLCTILTLSGYEKRSIKCTFNITKTLNMIYSALSSGTLLINGYFDHNQFIDFISKSNSVATEIQSNLYNIYMALDLVSTQLPALQTNPITYMDYDLDLYDPNAVLEINNKYFIRNPLNINML